MARELISTTVPDDAGRPPAPPVVVQERQHGPARQAIMIGLRSYNRDALGPVSREPMTVTLRDGGTIVGGLGAETYMGWLVIESLWVDAAHRGKGNASRLVGEAEDEARRRGATQAFVDTFSFQAPGFYHKLGYREFGRLGAFPVGHSRHFLTKTL